MFEFVWNYILLMLFLGALKAALSLRWPSIGEWRYDDLHPSLRYRDSSSVTKMLVNGAFFLVYPFILLWRWYRSSEWTDWTEVEKDLYEQNVELGEDELLRRGTLRGRMIIQKEILLSPGRSDIDDESFQAPGSKGTAAANDGFVEDDSLSSDDENELHVQDVPLNLSKDRSTPLPPECAGQVKIYDPPVDDYDYAANKEAEEKHVAQEVIEEVPLIEPSSNERQKLLASISGDLRK